MKKVKLQNQAVGPFPAMIVGAMMKGVVGRPFSEGKKLRNFSD